MSVYTDPTQTTQCGVDTVSVDGVQVVADDAVLVQVICTAPASLVAGHTPGGLVDPLVAQQIARAVLDTVATFTP